MKTFKVTFTNNSNKKDFCTVDAFTISEGFDIAAKELGIANLIAIDDVTGRFVNTNGEVI